jgi:hypothetical protein
VHAVYADLLCGVPPCVFYRRPEGRVQHLTVLRTYQTRKSTSLDPCSHGVHRWPSRRRIGRPSPEGFQSLQENRVKAGLAAVDAERNESSV